MTEITIPESVTSIEKMAFQGCTSLAKIIIPKNVISIDGLAFVRCDNLTIYGESGSYAETYANENNIPFTLVSNSNVDTTVTTTSTTEPITTTITNDITTKADNTTTITNNNVNSSSGKDDSSPKTYDGGIVPILALGSLLGAIALATRNKHD